MDEDFVAVVPDDRERSTRRKKRCKVVQASFNAVQDEIGNFQPVILQCNSQNEKCLNAQPMIAGALLDKPAVSKDQLVCGLAEPFHPNVKAFLSPEVEVAEADGHDRYQLVIVPRIFVLAAE